MGPINGSGIVPKRGKCREISSFLATKYKEERIASIAQYQAYTPLSFMHISTDCSSHSYMKRSFFTMVGLRIDLKSIGFQKVIEPLALVSFPQLTMQQFCQWLFIKLKGKATLDIMNTLLAKMHYAQQKKSVKNIQAAIKKHSKSTEKANEEKQLQQQLADAQEQISMY